MDTHREDWKAYETMFDSLFCVRRRPAFRAYGDTAKREGRGMDEGFRRRLEESGAEVKATLRRFVGNEDMYLRFLKMFPEDPSYLSLGKNLAAGNYVEAFKCAHTLKGVAANLGLVPVQNAVSPLVEVLRGRKNEEVDAAAAEGMWQELKDVYERTVEMIKAG